MSKGTDHILINTKSYDTCGKCTEACPKGVLGKVNIIFHKHVHIDEAEHGIILLVTFCCMCHGGCQVLVRRQ